jgi:hypothetical protein
MMWVLKRAVTWSTLFIGFVLVFTVTTASAGAQGSTPQGRQAILDYQLTLPKANHLITAMDAMTKHVVAMPNYQDRMRKMMQMTPTERLAAMEKDPAAMAILKANGLTPQEYTVGVPALRMALMAAQGMPSGPNITVSPANLAFAKANLAQLKPKWDAANGMRPQ